MTRSRSFLLPLLLVSFAVQDAETLFDQGRDALFRAEYEKAIELLRKAVEADASGTKTHYRLYLARALRYGEQAAAAEEVLKGVLAKSPDYVEAGQLLAEIYRGQERWKDIIAVIEPLLKYRHDYPTYQLLAESHLHLDQYPQAREHYEEALRLNPGSAPDHYQLGNIYLAQNRFALAAQSYESALRLGLDSAVLRYKLGSAYFNLRNYFGEVATVAVKSGKPGTLSGEWFLLEEIPGRPDSFRAAPRVSAVYQIATAIAAGLEERVDIQLLLANIYLNGQRYQRAYDMYTALAPKVPEEDRALFRYYFAQSAFGIGKYEEYVSHLLEAAKLDEAAYGSALVDAFVSVADRYSQEGNLAKHIEYLVRAVERSPQTASLHLRLGDAYEEARELGKAVQQWRMVLDLEPDHPQRTELLNRIGKHGVTG